MYKTTEFCDRQVTLLPRGTNDVIRTVARRKYTKPSEYVRRAILRQLEADGCCVIAPTTVEVIDREAA